MKILTGQEFLWKSLLTTQKTELWLSVHFALNVCCASFFLFHVGIQKCGGNSVLTEISQGPENVQQMWWDSLELMYWMPIKEMEDFTLISLQGHLCTVQIPFQHQGFNAFGSKAVLVQTLLPNADDWLLDWKFPDSVKSPSYTAAMPHWAYLQWWQPWQLLSSPSSETFPELPKSCDVCLVVLGHGKLAVCGSQVRKISSHGRF